MSFRGRGGIVGGIVKKPSLIAMSVVLANPAGAQVAMPAIVAGSGETPVPASRAETGVANQKALSATTEQTAYILRDRQAAADTATAYAETQADYVQAVRRYEADKAAITRNNAEGAQAYRQRLAAWQAVIDRRRQPVLKPTGTMTVDKQTRVICTFEQTTGSNMPVRVCR